jgi:hypothetical protein
MLFGAYVINVEISTNRLTSYLLEDRDSSYYHVVQDHQLTLKVVGRSFQVHQQQMDETILNRDQIR